MNEKEQPANQISRVDRAATILDRALELNSPERDAYMEGACGDDVELRKEVQAMLEAHEEAGDFLAAATNENAATIASFPNEKPGTIIDRYKILQLIGEGGFGAVYMADQQKPVKRRVALKIIKLGMDTKQVIARFEAERQALAMMDHPNIARVFDAGSTETGRPYFVMELVKGVPINEYCDTENLTTKQRLDLFMKVCNAVQHAHQKGIIHRDLKPSNVMVTLHDGKPVPKVIDFGIAKATNRELTDKTLFTEYRQLIGTPQYMSPEQAEMSGLDIDTRSDIYSLGVLLYELLTGVTPFDGNRLRSAALNEIQRIIREEEPSRPSTRLSELSRSSPSLEGRGQGVGKAPTQADVESRQSSIQYIAKHRKTDPGSLAKQLRGDLDWIIMKALEKDRSRRYETANGFAADVQRYLTDEPVTATPPSATYKLKKLIRRNKSAFTAAAAVFLVLTLGVVGTTWGLISAAQANEDLFSANTKLDAALIDANAQRERAEGNEATAVAEADRAERELARANEIKRLITEMFAGISPEQAQGADITLLRDILDGTAARLAKGKINDELVAAELHHVIGNVYWQLSLYTAAERHSSAALDMRKRLLGEEHANTLRSMNLLSTVYRDQSRYHEAESLLLETVAISRRLRGEEHPFTADSMGRLGLLYTLQRRDAEAEAMLLKTLEIHKRVLGEEHRSTLASMNNLALAYVNLRRYSKAEDLFRKTLALSKRVLGEEHPSTLNTMTNLARVYRFQGRFSEAEPLLLTTLEKKRRVLGGEHIDTLRCMGNLAFVYRGQGRNSEAEPLYLELIGIRKRVLGEEHNDTLGSTTNLGNLYNEMGRFDDARRMYETSLPIKRRVLGMQHPWTGFAMKGLAQAYEGLDRREDALALYRELLDLQLVGADDPDAAANTLNAAAWTLLTLDFEELQNPDRALILAERACAQEEANGGGSLWMYLDTLALAQHMTGDTAQAIETQQRAISLIPDGADKATSEELEANLRKYEAVIDDVMEVGN